MADRETLRVVSYNVRVDTRDDGDDAWAHRRDDLVRNVRVHRPDLLGLQEPLPEQLAALDAELRGFSFVGESRLTATAEGEYSPVGYRTTRFAVEDHGTFWLSESPGEPGSVGWDASHPRITTWVLLRDRRTDARLYHYNTHLDHEGERARPEAARVLRADVDDRTGDVPTVVTGDFNATHDDPAYRAILAGDSAHDDGARELVDAKDVAVHGHFGPETTFNDFAEPVPGRFIDHVFVTPGVEVTTHAVVTDTRANGRYPSDHFPVVVDFRLPSA